MLDDTLVQQDSQASGLEDQVLILIVLDDALVPNYAIMLGWKYFSLNPYCAGRCSSTRS